MTILKCALGRTSVKIEWFYMISIKINSQTIMQIDSKIDNIFW